MNLENDIQQYVNYFAERISLIKNIEVRMFRKILYMGIIDTLSRAAFPKVKGHRKRVILFIDKCSGWKDKDRVSAPQLMLILRENGLTDSCIYQKAREKVNSWDDGSIVRPEADLSYDDIGQLSQPKEEKFIQESTYKQLFYTYRNNLIHEFREPGYGMELSSDPSTPYYHGMIDDPWQLVFTDIFIGNLCMTCLIGLRNYLKKNKINPYDSYKFGSLWCRC